MFNKLFGKKPKNTNPPIDPSKDPNMIRVFDEYGRELFITKQQWRDNVLLGNLETSRNDPDQLYTMIVSAIQDGFAADVIPFAEHLQTIDPIASRAAVVLGIVYMETGRLDDAQKVLEEYITQHGEDGIVLTNLAKVYSRRGDQAKAESILWHALELDPNQENGLGWYAVMQKEQKGEGGDLEAYRRAANLPHSWRARLWLAQDAIQHKDLTTAETLYEEALALADRPIPADLLMQMSGDLGNAGYLAEIIRLVSPHFDPDFHGIQVGNNLIKANLDLGRVEVARQVLEELYNQKRPDWKQTLGFWETEITKARTSSYAKQLPPEKLSISLIGIEGPLWMRDASPFAALLPEKRNNAVRIAVFGSTALLEQSQSTQGLQLTDAPGRFSRAIPLELASAIQANTDADGMALIPWIEGQGFALFGKPYDDAGICQLAGNGEKPADFIVGFVIDATRPVWKLQLRMIKRTSGKRLEEKTFDATVENIGAAAGQLKEFLTRWLVQHAGATMLPAPGWYQALPPNDELDYLVRLEQQLAVVCKHFAVGSDVSLYGEREILDGALQLCLRHPSNPRVRMLYAQTLRQMKKSRPQIVSEYKDRTGSFQQKYPLDQEMNDLLEKAYAEAFTI